MEFHRCEAFRIRYPWISVTASTGNANAFEEVKLSSEEDRSQIQSQV